MLTPSVRGAIHSVSASQAVSMVSAEKFGRSPATHSLQVVVPSASSSSSSRIRRPVVRPGRDLERLAQRHPDLPQRDARQAEAHRSSPAGDREDSLADAGALVAGSGTLVSR